MAQLPNFTYYWYDHKDIGELFTACLIEKSAECIVPTCWPSPVETLLDRHKQISRVRVRFFIQEEIRSRAFHTSISPVNGSISFYSLSLSLSLSLSFFSFRGSRSIEVCRILTHENGPKGCASHDRCSIRSETTETARQIIYS